MVLRLRTFVSLLLLALWVPTQFPWALALVGFAHEAHHASLSWSHGRLHVVLQHDPAPHAAHHDHDAHLDDLAGALRSNDKGHPAHHPDHVIHVFTADHALSPTSIALHVAAARETLATVIERNASSWRAFFAPPAAPPQRRALRTTVLVI